MLVEWWLNGSLDEHADLKEIIDYLESKDVREVHFFKEELYIVSYEQLPLADLGIVEKLGFVLSHMEVNNVCGEGSGRVFQYIFMCV